MIAGFRNPAVASIFLRLGGQVWYGEHILMMFLLPFSWVYRILMALRRFAYARGWYIRQRMPLQVIVVGNIAVGGTGKTPMVLWLAQRLRSQGRHPAIVCGGYGAAKAAFWPQQVRPDSDVAVVGDEPVLLARRAGCPVVVDPDRVRAIRGIMKYYSAVDVVICDDGMQHLRLLPDVTISLVDGMRRYGNGRCLPAGPMREPESQLQKVDIQVCMGGACRRGEYPMQKKYTEPVSLFDGSSVPLATWCGTKLHAVAGVANPEPFFVALRQAGIRAIHHAFPDHWRYRKEDLEFADELPVLMTEKDAVKYSRWARPGYWYLPIQAELGNSFSRYLDALLERNEAWRESDTVVYNG